MQTGQATRHLLSATVPTFPTLWTGVCTRRCGCCCWLQQQLRPRPPLGTAHQGTVRCVYMCGHASCLATRWWLMSWVCASSPCQLATPPCADPAEAWAHPLLRPAHDEPPRQDLRAPSTRARYGGQEQLLQCKECTVCDLFRWCCCCCYCSGVVPRGRSPISHIPARRSQRVGMP